MVNSGTFGAAEDASVQVIDLSSASLVRTIPLPDGDSPWDIAVVGFDKAYVTNLYGDSITILDPRVDGPSAIIGTIDLPAGSGPAGILVDGDRAYTANTAIDPVTYAYGPGNGLGDRHGDGHRRGCRHRPGERRRHAGFHLRHQPAGPAMDGSG